MSSVTNPIPATQIVNVNLEWDFLSAPTCLTLEHSLQALVEEIKALKRPILEDAQCVTGVELGDILQGIIDKVCEVQNTVDTTNSIEVSYSINTLQTDNWQLGDECEIEMDQCGEITPESQIQALYSRMNSFCKVIQDLNTKIEKLETTISEQQLQLDNVQNCCE